MTSPRDEALAGDAAQGSEEHISNSPASIADASFCGNPGDRIEAIRLSLSRRGYSLHVLHDGTFVVACWNLLKTLPDLHALVHFARQIGGAA